jgi:transposase
MSTKLKLTNKQKGALADAFGKSLQTIERWVKEGNHILTSDKSKSVIKKNAI